MKGIFAIGDVTGEPMLAHPAMAQNEGIKTKVGLFPFRANGRAMTTGHEDGFIRVVALADTHEIIGIQAVGPKREDMTCR